MRIISGSLKGKKIDFLKNSITRPLKDSIKENIFNILIHSNNISIKLKNSDVLDLYAGVGSFGIECISRGAGKVTFIEKDNLAFVKSKYIMASGDIEVNYRLIRKDEGWKVYDIIFDGISLMKNYRADFRQHVNKSGVESLIDNLRK